MFSRFFSKNRIAVAVLLVFMSVFGAQAMKETQALAMVPVKNINDAGYVLGADEYFLDTGRGRTVCMRNDGIELAFSFPAQKTESLRLEAGLCAHNHYMGIVENPEVIFFASVTSKKTANQLCGLIGLPMGTFFVVACVGKTTQDKRAIKLLMAFVEEKVSAFTKFKRIGFLFPEAHSCCKDLLKLGYEKKGSRSDFDGGTEVLLVKDLQDIEKNSFQKKVPKEKYSDYVLSRKWLLYKGAKNVDALFEKTQKDFFSDSLIKSFESGKKDKENSLKAGVFVCDNNGKYGRRGENLGGCFVEVFNKAKVPHMYVALVWLNPKVRGGGLAQKFLETIEGWAKKKFRCQYSYLGTSDHQAPWLYKKCGYTAAITLPELTESDTAKLYAGYTFVKKLK